MTRLDSGNSNKWYSTIHTFPLLFVFLCHPALNCPRYRNTESPSFSEFQTQSSDRSPRSSELQQHLSSWWLLIFQLKRWPSNCQPSAVVTACSSLSQGFHSLLSSPLLPLPCYWSTTCSQVWVQQTAGKRRACPDIAATGLFSFCVGELLQLCQTNFGHKFDVLNQDRSFPVLFSSGAGDISLLHALQKLSWLLLCGGIHSCMQPECVKLWEQGWSFLEIYI